jgi:hypothetical protein
MRSRDSSSRSKQLVTALDRWQEDGGRPAPDEPVARDNRPDPVAMLLAMHREASMALH